MGAWADSRQAEALTGWQVGGQEEEEQEEGEQDYRWWS